MPKGLENLHIAIIMDGNGRWAKKRGLPRFLGHKEGVKAVKKIITHAAKNHLKALSIFAFSASCSIASLNPIPSIFIKNVYVFPPTPHPKQ